MFGKSEKIYVVYEKPEASEPTERVELVREGFALWAFILGILWLLGKRLWVLASMYFAVIIVCAVLTELLQFSEGGKLALQLWVQFMFGFHAYDLEGWWLKRRGYRFAGIIAAESVNAATRRYYEHAV